MKPSIAFAGMTHLGLCSGVAAAAKGFDVTLFDQDPKRIQGLSTGRFPVVEPNLERLFAENRTRLTFSADKKALARAELIYVAPDVPTDDKGQSDLDGLRDLLADIIPEIDTRAVLVVLSQVPPGFTRSLGAVPFALYYQVETLIFGQAMQRALKPERFIVGGLLPSEPLAPPLSAFLDSFECPILTMRYESAELAKISINMCLAASIGVANMLAELSEHVGADWNEIVPALKLDRRIGPYSYLAPGLGLSGGNLERDLATVITLAQTHNTDSGIVEAWLANSAHRKSWPWKIVQEHVLPCNPRPRIAVLGLAYKENTKSIKSSPSLALLAELANCDVSVFDPVVSVDVAPVKVTAARSAMNAIEGADVLAIMTPWPEFRSLEAGSIAKAMVGKTLIDPHRMIEGVAARKAGLDYFTLGAALQEHRTGTCCTPRRSARKVKTRYDKGRPD
jgi:UDPglucose 6-dehydrogenase